MNSEQLKKAVAVFAPAIVLDRIFSRETRAGVLTALNVLLATLFILTALAFGTQRFSFSSPDVSFAFGKLQALGGAVLGLLLIATALWLLFRALNAFYDSYYFTGLATVLPEAGLSEPKSEITFETAGVLSEVFRSGDLTGTFIFSKLGRRALARLGLAKQFLAEFLAMRTVVSFSADKFSVGISGQTAKLSDVASAVVASDTAFAKFLSLHDISVKDLVGASEWVERTEMFFRNRARFWGRDELGRISGVGKNWSYGGAYTLERFAHDITERGKFDTSDASREYASELNTLEAVLARSGESNALLVSEPGAGGLDIVMALGARIAEGSVLPSLEHKRIFLFDENAFIAAEKDKARFESELLHIFNEIVRAGNIILVVSDLPNFIGSAKAIGSDIIALADPYLASPDFQMIAMANPGAFHQSLEEDSKILHRFEKILVKARDIISTMRILEDHSLVEESGSRVFFTYQSLSAVAEGAKRYFTDGVMSDRAIHLLAEVAQTAQAKKKTVVERGDVLAVIESKTGIATGEIGKDEREKLLHLEDTLHLRIIGQDEAVKAISGALRRARSDIENSERPMGSFLFLGPTGVGKTETTKALASVFFGKEESIIRFDMSEYQTDDALTRLIGSFEDGKAGVLSSKLRDESTGVLLLDEFEKTNTEVLNLFLQILDEGFFSDMSGTRVNARNLIIIATSNAGSDMIWKMLGEGKDLSANKDAIIAEIINRGIFKPELLNRFDGVILFHPLTTENLQKIAMLMLKKLQKRLTEKGIELVINDALLKAVMDAGTDPQFGARPMNRAIQEKVEQVIAQKIISGEVKSGSSIELTEEELK